MSISIAIATFNEEKNILRTLESVYDWASEIVIVDGSSTDQTINIIRGFDKERKILIISTSNPSMFHINKQKAIERCKGDWILQLDADEVVSSQLKDEILKVINPKSQILNPKQSQNSKRLQNLNLGNSDLFRDSKLGFSASDDYIAYWLPRLNFFLGRPLRKGGQYPDYTIRLYKNGSARFPCKDVHEQVTINDMVILSESEGSTTQRVGFLNSPLLHYPYPTFAEYLRKWKLYCALEAENLKKQGVKPSLFLAFRYLIYYPKKWFLLTYFRHLGILDGIPGFVFSFMSAIRFWKIYNNLLKLS